MSIETGLGGMDLVSLCNAESEGPGMGPPTEAANSASEEMLLGLGFMGSFMDTLLILSLRVKGQVRKFLPTTSFRLNEVIAA